MREYKLYRKLIEKFLEDERVINVLFSGSNKVLKLGMYARFLAWCEGKTKIRYKRKDIFFEEVLSRAEYYECICWGKEFIVNKKIDSKGTGIGEVKVTVF